MLEARDAMSVLRRKAGKWGQTPFPLLLVLLMVLSGCAANRPSPQPLIRVGKFAEARDLVEAQVVNDRSDRRFMLDRMRAGVLNLDAGDPIRAERWFAEVYDVLRTQGLNADKTVASIVLTEGVKVWKGEPFEQAMALVYYGFVQASLGSWDNARSAAGNALFFLRDFEKDERAPDGKPAPRIDTAELAKRAAAYEKKRDGGGDGAFESGDEYLDNGYVAEQNNFTMAYLLHAIASQQLARDREASDYYNRVLTLAPQMRPLVDQLRAGNYNTIVVIADGLSPRKIATGPGGALSRYQPIDRKNAPAKLYYAGERLGTLPMVTDVNTMALDHRWNNLEDVRIAKNIIGDVAIVGGSVVLAEAARKGDGDLALIGAGVVLLGAAVKSTARANTDYCDVFPQRLFVAALNVKEPGHELVVEVPGYGPLGGVSLRKLGVPKGPEASLYYLRAPVRRDLGAPIPAPALP